MLLVIVNEKGIPLPVEVESASTYEGHVAEKTIDGIEVQKHESRRKTRSDRFPSE